MNNNLKNDVVCFGEMLWDMPPGEKHPGGAPMNVALNLLKMGVNAVMVSSVGRDDLGVELLDYVKANGMNVKHIILDEHRSTGTVPIDLSDPTNVRYSIIKNVAWDHIALNQEMVDLVTNAKYFVFGSLAARSSTTCNTLLELTEKSKFNVFDVNLRPPDINPDIVLKLLAAANLVKLNEEEIITICNWLNFNGTMKKMMKFLQEKFDIKTLGVTRGAQGAIFLIESRYFTHPGYQISVASTTGSGDAFLAGWLKKLLTHATEQEALEFACGLGALVATYTSANPELPLNEMEIAIRDMQKNS
jgi:fructokinase